jgi:predicted MFS family arabinose efflux permease
LWSFFVCVNLGFGIRAPVGFYKALQSAGTNESRGSALIVLFIMLTVAIGTALVAPFIEKGLVYVGAIAASISIASVWLSSRFADSWEKRFVAEEIS